MAEAKKYKEKTMDIVAKLRGWIGGITELGLSIIALGVVLQVLFGSAIPFIGGDIVGNISALIGSLGSQGLVGLITVGILLWLFNHLEVE